MKKIIKKKFDSKNLNWDSCPEFNEMFLNTQKIYFDNILKTRGFVFLRDVYETFGLNITIEACIFGWNIDNDHSVEFEIHRIEGTSDYELIFECYPILEYFDKEEGLNEED